MSARQAPGCQARQASDEMRCGPCGLVWDVNDPDPPHCGRLPFTPAPEPAAAAAAGRTVPLEAPLVLPADLAERMARAYEAARRGSGFMGRTPEGAMHAAWRVFLDEAAA